MLDTIESINSQISELSAQMEENKDKATADVLGLKMHGLKIRKSELLNKPSQTFTPADKAEFDALDGQINALESQINDALNRVGGAAINAPANRDMLYAQINKLKLRKTGMLNRYPTLSPNYGQGKTEVAQ